MLVEKSCPMLDTWILAAEANACEDMILDTAGIQLQVLFLPISLRASS
jgi:hypothetical protein